MPGSHPQSLLVHITELGSVGNDPTPGLPFVVVVPRLEDLVKSKSKLVRVDELSVQGLGRYNFDIPLALLVSRRAVHVGAAASVAAAGLRRRAPGYSRVWCCHRGEDEF
jgi:hypothetical protein